MWSEPFETGTVVDAIDRIDRSNPKRQTTTYDTHPQGAFSGCRNFGLIWLDYERSEKSVNVVAAPKGEGSPTAAGIEIRTGNGTEKESGKVGTAEREKRES
ncbi:hypothetical protein ACFYXM_36360, partial [Streptomyces sp. NPDC002476]|uniref:hypothetical protein n=1 Tax=Streptomyces sp. NPDC002476 TaxID=3364648 RepID=UPI003676AEB4